MFSLKRLEDLADGAAQPLSLLNTRVLEALGRRIALARSGSGFDRLSTLGAAEKEAEALYQTILRTLGNSSATAEQIYAEAAKIAYKNANRYYAARGLKQLEIKYQTGLINFVLGVANTTRSTFTNLSNSSAIGFRVLNADGSIKYTGFKEQYMNLVDQAIAEVATGQGSYTSALRHAMKQTADSGIRLVDYQGGYSRRLDSAMRQNVLDGVKDIAHEVSRRTGEEFGADGVEISAHNYCAMDHLPFQGKQFSNQQFEDVQNSLKRHFGSWNCRHTLYAIILGVSSPSSTDEELREMEATSTEKRVFEGREYTGYEATQLQRKIETAMRASKDRAVMAKAAGDDLTRRVEQARLNQLKDKYIDLSKAFGLPLQSERMSVSGFRPVKQTLIKPEQIDFRNPDKVQHIANLPNFQHLYSELDPGKQFALEGKVYLTHHGINHVLIDHPDRLSWVESNKATLIKAITSPEIIEKTTRELRMGYRGVTHIVRSGMDSRGRPEYLVVGISLSGRPGHHHQLTTIYQKRYRNIFNMDGTLKPAYRKAK